ncbi:MAG: sel1 repeat family protein, partial [Muribaculaceae bacterium]|nr:sel1 repeat family protein [Muribaculaceae bacterium]
MKRLVFALIALLFVSGVGFAQDAVRRKKPNPVPPRPIVETHALTPSEMVDKGWEAEQMSDYTEAVKWYLKAAEQGDVRAQKSLGRMYENGQGVTQNYTEAVKWYRKAAEQGDAAAQYNLGDMYKYGYGVYQNSQEAVRWYRKAAEQGYIDAQHTLGDMYYLGKGVSKDYSEAAKWYRMAAEQG